jgi:hypothetical protein
MQKNQLISSFSKKRSLNEIPIGSNGKLLLPCGGHLGYAISTKITNLAEDHPVIISIMLQFHRLSSLVVYLIYYFGADWKSNMAARANNVF